MSAPVGLTLVVLSSFFAICTAQAYPCEYTTSVGDYYYDLSSLMNGGAGHEFEYTDGDTYKMHVAVCERLTSTECDQSTTVCQDWDTGKKKIAGAAATYHDLTGNEGLGFVLILSDGEQDPGGVCKNNEAVLLFHCKEDADPPIFAYDSVDIDDGLCSYKLVVQSTAACPATSPTTTLTTASSSTTSPSSTTSSTSSTTSSSTTSSSTTSSSTTSSSTTSSSTTSTTSSTTGGEPTTATTTTTTTTTGDGIVSGTTSPPEASGPPTMRLELGIALMVCGLCFGIAGISYGVYMRRRSSYVPLDDEDRARLRKMGIDAGSTIPLDEARRLGSLKSYGGGDDEEAGAMVLHEAEERRPRSSRSDSRAARREKRRRTASSRQGGQLDADATAARAYSSAFSGLVAQCQVRGRPGELDKTKAGLVLKRASDVPRDVVKQAWKEAGAADGDLSTARLVTALRLISVFQRGYPLTLASLEAYPGGLLAIPPPLLLADDSVAAGAPMRPLPSSGTWQEVTDSATGAVYYYNPTTRESRWDRPAL